ncbi:DUF1707 SHOCT-like domain-containing protein [Nocardia brevicatena]|uniref:DUF1707 SHOCT-like domain-containing protein n=1 Tax=Nocardia brevicatena TaxID=37327 RepID=UPI0002DECB7A|nr:DUF1707 domain-containing protein [Nocardia brevicatena]
MTDAHDHTENPPARAVAIPVPRVSDVERDITVRRLQLAVGDGRLDLAELDRRLVAAYSAVTAAELTAVTADLPDPAAEPLELVVKSGSRKKAGEWTVPVELSARCNSGSIIFDFTAAFCPYPEVTLRVDIKSGSVVLIVPNGWQVDLDRVVTNSGTVADKVLLPRLPDAPLVRVEGRVASGTIKARYPRRSFWAWLLRRPR